MPYLVCDNNVTGVMLVIAVTCGIKHVRLTERELSPGRQERRLTPQYNLASKVMDLQAQAIPRFKVSKFIKSDKFISLIFI